MDQSRDPRSWRRGLMAAALAVCAQAADGDGAYERSLAMAREVLSQRPQDPRIIHVLGGVHFRRGRFRDAISSFEEVLRVDPAFTEALFSIGEAYLQLEDYSRSVETYGKILALPKGPDAPRARHGLAEAHFRSGRYTEAIDEARAAIEGGDGSADVYYLLGRALDARLKALDKSAGKAGVAGDAARLASEALATLEKAVAIDPAHASAHYLLAISYRRRGDSSRERRHLEEFRSRRPAATPLDSAESARAESLFEARTAVRLARPVFESGDTAAALGLVQRALSVLPDFDEALLYQAWIHLRTERLQEAQADYERVLAQDHDQPEALWNLGKLHLRAGRVAAAAPLLLRAAQLRRNFGEGWELLVELSREHNIYADRAEEFARHALRLRPTVRNYSTLAIILFETGKAAESRNVLLEGLKRHPADKELQMGFEALQQAAGSPR